MKKILLIEHNLQPPGGGKAVTAWILEALKQEYEITILTWNAVDFDSINNFYGTSLSSSDFNLYTVPWVWQSLINLIPDQSDFQKLCLLMRLSKIIQVNYDIVMTISCNEVDLGVRGIQYINYPYLYHLYQQLQGDFGQYSYDYLKKIKTHLRPWKLISGYSFERMKQNLTLVNSNWIGKKIKKCYGIETKTVYPPVHGIFPQIPWEEKENGFVCIGRIILCKRFKRMIKILTEVRARGYDIHLHIIGTANNDLIKDNYYLEIKQLIQINNSWIFFHENLSRKELINLVSKHRYGIHGMLDEHFGIAVAEMIKGGCITFIPGDGGQVEIVGEEKRLLYQTVGEAVEKIVSVISNPDEQKHLCQYLQDRSQCFSIEQFKENIKIIVRQF
ncbi:hypothetical protein C7H19_13615 [Aphanothece hegewaldii CCALA 016]|uniref:Glycosyl transferase family 1 domain-containing protein n=1 Tax=Aphanothece hegewaldii CCALA 016 TaxID=2107694 RepID=A0A2T1LWG5_9CHRO|nr:glycosyltransferase [Aphanothece hegewaldii]PSF36240.1 hypothetical protein C7H19_13615 [Aphanothece hegewaldii CCALA 016]